jgi:hypothetical protein
MITLSEFDCPETRRMYEGGSVLHQMRSTRNRRVPNADVLFHVYVPESCPPYGVPKVGSRALCGYVKRTPARMHVGRDHPLSCPRCLEAAGEREVAA